MILFARWLVVKVLITSSSSNSLGSLDRGLFRLVLLLAFTSSSSLHCISTARLADAILVYILSEPCTFLVLKLILCSLSFSCSSLGAAGVVYVINLPCLFLWFVFQLLVFMSTVLLCPFSIVVCLSSVFGL